MLNYDVLSAFNADYYKDLITKARLGDETVIKVNGEQMFVFPIKYKGRVYALKSKVVEDKKLPIKIQKTDKSAYRSNVYHVVKKFASARIVEEKAHDFRELIDILASFEHSNKQDFVIYVIAIFMLYIKKGFIRGVSEAAFGKNSIPQILKLLMTDVAIINPRTTAAVEHKLINTMLVLDELTNLEKTQRDLLQEALLRIGDNSPTYEKGTRGSAKIGTLDEYDISKLSVVILYNVLQYYVDCGQSDKYFDNIFQNAVKDRYLPLYLTGVLDGSQFEEIKNPNKYAKEMKEDIKKVIRTIKYFQSNFDREVHGYTFEKEYVLSKSKRIDKTFWTICQGLDAYAKDEAEYREMVERLYQMHMKYIEMIKASEIEEVPLSTLVGKKDETL